MRNAASWTLLGTAMLSHCPGRLPEQIPVLDSSAAVRFVGPDYHSHMDGEIHWEPMVGLN